MTRRRSAPWGNRIVKTGTIQAGQLLAHEQNWRVHPRAQQEVLSGLLNEVGFVQGVIINVRSGREWGQHRGVETLVDGHLRAELALARDETTELPCVWVDLTPEEERVVLASFDPVGDLAVPDADKLAALVAEMPEDLLELTAVLRAERKGISKTVTFEARDHLRVVVDCESASQRDDLLRRLTGDGYTARAE